FSARVKPAHDSIFFKVARNQDTEKKATAMSTNASQADMNQPEKPNKAMRLVRPDDADMPRSSRRELTLPKPPVLANRPDSSALRRGFGRRWPLAIILGAVAAVGVFALVYYLMPERFKGFALLQVASTKPSLALEGGDSRGDFTTYLKTQAARIKSRDVLMK